MSHTEPHIGTHMLPMPIWPAETYPREPIQGWIHRAAERNYAYSTDSFIDSLGLSGRDWDYDELLNVVQRLPIDCYTEIEHCTPKRSGEGYEICGHKVPLRFICKNERRICPICLEERRYVRAWFDFVPVVSCPYHDVALIDGLPNDPLDWRHTEIGWTRSGTKIQAAHATTQIASRLDQFIVKSLTGDRVSLPNQLDGLSLEAILVASACVGKLHRGGKSHNATHASLRSLSQLGFDPLCGGSDVLINSLRRAEWLQPGYDRAKFKTRCNSAPNMLASIQDKNLRNLVSDAFTRARVKNGLITPSGRLSKYDGEDDHLNIKGAARRLGLTPHTMRVLLSKLAIVAKNSDNHRGLRLNERQLSSVQKYIQSAYDAEEAAKRLGCTPEDIESLAARRLLLPAFRMTGKNRYTGVELDAFVNSIASPSLCDPSLDGKHITSFAKEIGISLAEASSRILRDRSLVIVDHDTGSLFFDGLKVADAPREHLHLRLRPKAQVRDAITFAEAAARLGTKHEGVKNLIESSLIKTVKDCRNKNRVCPDSLELFERRYVKAAAYAPVLCCHPTSALKILRTKGVLPVNDWKSAGTRFVDRDEVMRITGLASPEAAVSAEWYKIKDELEEHLAARTIPATTRITAEPAIEVKATTGRWSFLVKGDQGRQRFSLTSSFTSTLQPARLRKVQRASIEPGEIWPGASVNSADGRGFVLVDEALGCEPDGATEFNLVDHVITRACQLHRFL